MLTFEVQRKFELSMIFEQMAWEFLLMCDLFMHILFVFVPPRSAQNLLLALCSGNTFGCAWETDGYQGLNLGQPWVRYSGLITMLWLYYFYSPELQITFMFPCSFNPK